MKHTRSMRITDDAYNKLYRLCGEIQATKGELVSPSAAILFVYNNKTKLF